jgi:colanic acid/amylovoran biosynthesis glycosyltransferase
MPRSVAKPTLLVAASTFPSKQGDGTPGFVLDLAQALTDDFRVVVVAPMVAGSQRRETMGGVIVRRYSYFPKRWQDLAHGAIIDNLRAKPARYLQVPFFFAAMAFSLASARRAYRPDVAHLHWIIPQGIVGRFVLGRTPRVVTTLGGDLYALRGGLFRRLKRQVIESARYVTCMSHDMATELAALGARTDQIRVVPMGVDLGPIERATASVERSSRQILFVGRLVEKKGASVFLDALERLGGGPVPEVVVIGDGPLRASLEARASSNVSLVGAKGRDDLAAAYARAAIAVYPSVPAANGDRDGLPVALLEAMAAGCAVVCSRVPGIVDVVEDGVNGLLVEPGDATALADALAKLLADDELRIRLGDAARATSASYTVDAIAATYRALLLDTCGAA